MAASVMSFGDSYRLELAELRRAMEAIDPQQVEQFIEAITSAKHVFVVGVGRVMLSLQAFAKRLNHLGIPAYCVGDINEPAITAQDLLIVGSGSGESVIPLCIARRGKQLGAQVAHIGSNSLSSLAPFVDLFIRIPVTTKLNLPDEISSEQIMTSLFEQALFLLGDAIVLLIARRCNIDIQNLWQYHANLE